jgi:hypothetical protein
VSNGAEKAPDRNDLFADSYLGRNLHLQLMVGPYEAKKVSYLPDTKLSLTRTVPSQQTARY